MRFRHSLSRASFAALMLMMVNIAAVDAQTAEGTPEATAAASPPLTLVWQTEFTPEAALFSPGDMAVDASGNVYVSTQSSNTVKKFDSDGKFVTQWGGSGKDEGEFSLSFGVALDAEANVYVTDFYNLRVQKFDSDGKFLMQWPTEESTSPAFIGIDGGGNVYVDEFPPHDGHYIQKFDSSGTLLSEWGNDDGNFAGRIEDIAVDPDGNVFVADATKNQVKKLDTNGKLLITIGGESSKTGNGYFFNPFGMAVDNEGFIYELDRYFLQKLDADGNFVAQWSTEGGELDRAANVTVDAEGNIYVFAFADVTSAAGDPVNVPVLKKFAQSKQW